MATSKNSKTATSSSARSTRPAPKSKKASPKKRSSQPKSNDAPSVPRTLGEAAVTIDRRREERRLEGLGVQDKESLATEQGGAVKLEKRKKVQRRRQIDPTTCERDYSVEEVEFMNALDDYKRRSGRMFPTCSEVLEVIHLLGYVKLSPAGQAALRGDALAEGVAATADASEEWDAEDVELLDGDDRTLCVH